MLHDLAAPVLGVPQYRAVDAFAEGLDVETRQALVAQLAPLHTMYFPSYPHALEELEQQALTGEHPAGERVHAWVVFRDGIAVGEWIMAVNRERGVIMMLFGAITREARIDLDRGYLPRLVDDLLTRTTAIASASGDEIVAVILESSGPHLARWQEAGFFVADAHYREPKHGRHWPDRGELTFFEDYSACVRPWGQGTAWPRSDLGVRALSALLVDHYGLPADHPQVLRSLAAAAAVSPPTPA